MNYDDKDQADSVFVLQRKSIWKKEWKIKLLELRGRLNQT